jgi:TetR/AcrR family transcriptional regulator, transcriptional repressor for nem operon
MTKDTYIRILDSAQALLASYGYNAFSYADISTEVGIGKATIHHHFPTKADLAVAVLARYREMNRQAVGNVLSAEPRAMARLGTYVGYWEHCIRNNDRPFCIGALLAAELPSLPDQVVKEVQGHFADFTNWLTQVIDEGLKNGELRSGNSAENEAHTLLASVHGAMLAARVAGGDAALYSSIANAALQRLKA